MNAQDRLLNFLQQNVSFECYWKVRDRYGHELSKQDVLTIAQDCSNRIPWGRYAGFKKLYEEVENE
uniref:Uncharacterized protein n=1 Tax=viral metagenome TaxID=1070528 RepID=A0A6M3L598_9ZZZZ